MPHCSTVSRGPTCEDSRSYVMRRYELMAVLYRLVGAVLVRTADDWIQLLLVSPRSPTFTNGC